MLTMATWLAGRARREVSGGVGRDFKILNDMPASGEAFQRVRGMQAQGGRDEATGAAAERAARATVPSQISKSRCGQVLIAALGGEPRRRRCLALTTLCSRRREERENSTRLQDYDNDSELELSEASLDALEACNARTAWD